MLFQFNSIVRSHSHLLLLLSLLFYFGPLQAAAPVFDVRDFGAILSDGKSDDLALDLCLAKAIQFQGVCQIPKGTLDITMYPQRIREPIAARGVRDLNGAALRGTGRDSIIRGTSVRGFDILQLNSVANFSVEGLALLGVKSPLPDGTMSLDQGVNGISITNGSHDIRINSVHVLALPYVAKSNYIDGGKAFTVQTGLSGTQPVRNISVTNCSSQAVAFGFGLDSDTNKSFEPYNIVVSNNTFQAFVAGIYFSFVSVMKPQAMFGARIENNKVIAGLQGIILSRGRSYYLKSNGIRLDQNLQTIRHRLYAEKVLIRFDGVEFLTAELNSLYGIHADAFYSSSGVPNSSTIRIRNNAYSSPPPQMLAMDPSHYNQWVTLSADIR